MEKQKKKTKSSDWIMVGIFMLIGGFCGFMMISITDSMDFDKNSIPELVAFFILMFVMMYLAMFLQIVIHEAGHLIFGLATGYEFSSFRIGSLLWMKEDGKMKMKKYSLAGTGGQCLMRPPKMIDGKIPVVLYNLGGSIINAASAIVFLILSFVAGKETRPLIYYFCMIMALIGFAYALMNGIPMTSGMVDNDGKNALSLGKNPKAMRALWIQLEMNHLLSTGTSIKRMKKEWFKKPSEEDMQNNLTASLAVFRCNRLMDEMKFAQAKEEMEAIVKGENAVAGLHKGLLTNDIIFCELIDGCDKTTIDKLLTKEQKKIMKAMKTFPSVLRTEYVYALIYEEDRAKAEKIMKHFDKIAKTYPYPIEIESEKRYMEFAEKYTKKLSNMED